MTDLTSAVDSERLQTLARRVCDAAEGRLADDPADAGLHQAVTELREYLDAHHRPSRSAPAEAPVEITVDLLLHATESLSAEGYRAILLSGLLPHLTAAQFQDVVTTAVGMQDEAARQRLIVAMAARLSPEQVETVFASVMTMGVRHCFIDAVAALLAHLTPAQRAVAVPKALRQLVGHPYRVNQYFWQLTPHLTRPELDAALGMLAAATTPPERAMTLTWAASYVTRTQLDDVLDCVLTQPDGNAIAIALPRIAPHCDARQFERVLSAAAALPHPGHRARALTGLILYVPEQQRPTVIADAVDAVTTAGGDDMISNIAVPDLLPYLTPQQVGRLLDMVRRNAAGLRLAWHLGLLAQHLTGEQPAQALEIALAVTEPHDRYPAIASVVPYLAPHLREAAADPAIDALRLHDGWVGTEPIAALAATMTSEQRSELLDVAVQRHDVTYIISGMAEHLDPHQVARAFEAGIAIVNEAERIGVLLALTPRLDSEQLATALTQFTAIREPLERADALLQAAVRIPAAGSGGFASAAVLAAGEIAAPYDRATMLTKLAGFLPPEYGPRVLGQAYNAAVAVEKEFHRASALTALIGPALGHSTTQ